MAPHPFRRPQWHTTITSRSTEAPMDYEYTHPASTRLPPSSPFLAHNSGGPPPRKRPHQDPGESGEGSMMEWEPESRGERKERLWGANAGAGGAFLFQPPEGLDIAPPAQGSGAWSKGGVVSLDPKALGVEDARASNESERPSPDANSGALMLISTNGLRHEQESRRRKHQQRTSGSSKGKRNGSPQRRRDATVEDLEDSDDDEDAGGSVGRRGGKAGDTHNHLSLYGWPGSSHQGAPQSTPAVLLSYVDLFFRSAVVVLAIYVAGVFIWAFAHDISDKLSHYSTEIRQDILHCSTQYTLNRCDPPSSRTPLTAASCEAWEHCMNRDPSSSVGRLRVAAEAGGEVVTGFVDALSWKTSGFMLVLGLGGFYAFRATARALPHPSHSISSPSPHPSSSHVPTLNSYPAPHHLPAPHHYGNHGYQAQGYGLPVPREWRPGIPLSFGPVEGEGAAAGGGEQPRGKKGWFS